MTPRTRTRDALHITKRSVDALKAESEDYFAWDDQLIGFGVRVYATGQRVFVLKYRLPGDLRTKRTALGRYPLMTPTEARKKATGMLGRLAHGESPTGEDASERRRRTLDALFPQFLLERGPKLKPRTVAEYQRLWTSSLAPTFGAVRVSVLSEDQVLDWHTSRAATPMLANRGVDLLAALCTWAERRKYRARHSNPCTRDLVERYPETTRKKSLRVEDYQRLGAALTAASIAGVPPAPSVADKSRGMSTTRRAKLTGRTRGPYRGRAPQLLPASADLTPSNPVLIAALRFLALSGWREQEALSLRWDVIDLPRGVVTLPDTKTGRSVRPLGGAALDVLRAQPRIEGNPYVFPGARKGSHLRETKHTWSSVRHAAGVSIRLHDLRHSFTTVARTLGFGDHVIAPLIGHTLDGMTSKYGDVPEELVQQAANRIAATIAQYLSGDAAKVLPFAPRKAIAG